MRSFRPYLTGFLLILFIPLTWVIWRLQSQPPAAPAALLLPTLAATAALPTAPPVTLTATARPTLPATFTPAAAVAAVTAVADAQAVAEPTATLAGPSATETPLPEIVDVTPESLTVTIAAEAAPETPSSTAASRHGEPCPNEPRLKPEYQRYYLAGQPWPEPSAGGNEVRLWLAKPFPGGGRFLMNQGFPYGYDLAGRLLLHNGVDSAEPLGTPVLAVADGTIVVAQDDRGRLFGWRCDWYGHLVVLELDQTWLGQPVYVLYGHVLEIGVEPGQRVSRGQPLAEVGFGGAATAAHLHLEIRIGANLYGSTRNPALWIDPATRGVIAGRLLDPLGRPWRGVGLSLIGRSPDASSGNTWSYMVDPAQIVNINPDEILAENFVFSDVRPGEYDIYTKVQGIEYRVPVSVTAGQISTLEIVTQPYMTPTPDPG